jgi:xanthine dehydrogenase large subunit
MYGIGAFFAIRNAIKAFNPSVDVKFSAPITPEKVLMSLYPKPYVEKLSRSNLVTSEI